MGREREVESIVSDHIVPWQVKLTCPVYSKSLVLSCVSLKITHCVRYTVGERLFLGHKAGRHVRRVGQLGAMHEVVH